MDENGAPLAIHITGANQHDKWSADDLIEAIVIERPDPENVEQHFCADKGYDYDDVRTRIQKESKKAVIPRRQNAICPGVKDKKRYKTRSTIERFLAHIKENKRLALRFEKRDVTFMAFFVIATMKVLKLFC